MKKIAFFLLAICGLITSCSKNVYVPVSYTVEDSKGMTPKQFYIASDGVSSPINLTVKFLTGSPVDSVTLQVEGLPAGVTVTPQTTTALPTYNNNYVFTSDNVAFGTYPISLIGSAPHTANQVYNVNLVVIPPDCASLFYGSLSSSNICSARTYGYTATGSAVDSANTLSINNFGGYGLNTNTIVKLNCETDSLTIPSQNIGNEVTISGYGTFTSTQMTIYYSAVTTPGAAAENCTATITKN